ncbi:hypothetical protein [Psychrilyobacter sp.]|uniref:hypothetical protein n=1 Tax=Psychrilyobacter sp. TaxID=2586924 RepID=UPI00301733D1
MSFKDIINKDRGVFINPGEFAEEHTWNDIPIVCIEEEMDFDKVSKSLGSEDGHYRDIKTIFIETELIEKPVIHEEVYYDDEKYSILFVSEEDGIYEIKIERNESW